jgi:hypothetical protein
MTQTLKLDMNAIRALVAAKMKDTTAGCVSFEGKYLPILTTKEHIMWQGGVEYICDSAEHAVEVARRLRDTAELVVEGAV